MARRSLAAFLSLLAAARAGTVGFAGTYVSGGGGPPTTLDALGAWAAALGAPETTETARLPATSLVKPPRRLALSSPRRRRAAPARAYHKTRAARRRLRRWARPSGGRSRATVAASRWPARAAATTRGRSATTARAARHDGRLRERFKRGGALRVANRRARRVARGRRRRVPEGREGGRALVEEVAALVRVRVETGRGPARRPRGLGGVSCSERGRRGAIVKVRLRGDQ